MLEWVHGYRGNDCRNAAMYTASGEVLFFAGSLVVRYASVCPVELLETRSERSFCYARAYVNEGN